MPSISPTPDSNNLPNNTISSTPAAGASSTASSTSTIGDTVNIPAIPYMPAASAPNTISQPSFLVSNNPGLVAAAKAYGIPKKLSVVENQTTNLSQGLPVGTYVVNNNPAFYTDLPQGGNRSISVTNSTGLIQGPINILNLNDTGPTSHVLATGPIKTIALQGSSNNYYIDYDGSVPGSNTTYTVFTNKANGSTLSFENIPGSAAPTVQYSGSSAPTPTPPPYSDPHPHGARFTP